MITPDYLNKIVRATEHKVSELHIYLIGRIANHIASFFGDPEKAVLIPSTIKQMHKMMESGKVYDDIKQELETLYPSIEKEVKQAFLNSAEEISEANTEFEKEIIKKEGLDIEVPDSKDLNLTDYEIRLLEADYARTNGTIKNLAKTTADASQTAFVNACDSAVFKVQHGTSPSVAITEAIEEMASKGISITTYGNNSTNIEVAIARAVRTGINQANAHIVLQRCAELGVGYVAVSEHYGARVTDKNDYTNHAWWQGKAYKIDWDKPEFASYSHEAKGHIKEIADALGQIPDYDYPDLVQVTGYGDILGLCGVNCRHTFSAFYPEFEDAPEPRVDYEENEKRYREEQGARARERAIRKTKREIAAYEGTGLKTPEIKEKLELAKAKLNRQLESYYSYCRKYHINIDSARITIA